MMQDFNVDEFIERSFAEDVGDGDHTSLACIPGNAKGRVHLLVKDNGIIAGVEIAEKILKKADPYIIFNKKISDGAAIKKGDIAFEAEGNIQALLKAERLLLNCMQRMSGIATYTSFLVSKLHGLNTKLLDTRKTTPGFRYFEKMAVKAGGGVNHRFGLYDMIMIKDNHIDFAGGITPAIEAVKSYLKKKNKDLDIEVEARSVKDVEEILTTGGIRRILLDNFMPQDMKEAVEIINKRCETEASGGITEKNIRQYAETGVDYISVGALTHQVKSLDLSLKAIK